MKLVASNHGGGQMSERDTSDIRLGSVNFASSMLRRAIVVLMVLVPLSAIYAFVFGGVAGGANADIFYVRGTPGMPFTMTAASASSRRRIRGLQVRWTGRVPSARGAASGYVTTRCDEKDGVRTCTTTERTVPLEEAAPDTHAGFDLAGAARRHTSSRADCS